MQANMLMSKKRYIEIKVRKKTLKKWGKVMLIFNRIFVIQTNTKMYSFICSFTQ